MMKTSQKKGRDELRTDDIDMQFGQKNTTAKDLLKNDNSRKLANDDSPG